MNSSDSFLNFDIQLSGNGDEYRAKVIESPAGHASLKFILPFSRVELENFILKTNQNRSNLRSLNLDSDNLQSAEKFGGDLFNCLFTEDIAQRFRTSLAIARSQDAGLRLRFGFSDAPTLIDIPWELLFDSDNKQYLGLSIETPIIRKLDLASQPRLREVKEYLNILVMISSPEGYAPLDVEREWDQINRTTQTLQKNNRILLTRIEPSLLALQSALRRGKFHVFHYIGHGGFSKQSNDGVLVLEDSENKGDLVSGQFLGTILHDHSTLQLAFLNSCDGGRTSVADPFAGVGQTLLQKLIPAVIAMQFEITDNAAITFSEGFYNALVDGYTIETAVAEARKMVYISGNELEWATPVLYTAIEGGILLRKPTVNSGSDNTSLSQDEPQLSNSSQKLETGPKLAQKEHSVQPKSLDQPEPSITSIGITDLLKGIIIVGVLLMVATALVLFFQQDKITGQKIYNLPNNLTLVPIPPGSFMMGSNLDKNKEKPVHKVTFKNPFWMSKTEITFDQYKAYATSEGIQPNDESLEKGKHPVINVTWNNAQGYAKWLSSNNNKGMQCRLPSEAEWEYSARAESITPYSWGEVPSHEQANYGTNSCCKGLAKGLDKWINTAPVGSFPKNKWGLHDMHGNVQEWVQDTYQKDYNGAPKNGEAWEKGSEHRVIRGGSWYSSPYKLRSAYRASNSADYSDLKIGFRVICFPKLVD